MTISLHTYTALLDAPGGPYELDVSDGSVTMDEGWSPHVQASLTITQPAEAVLELLDPRTEARITITATCDFGGWNASPPAPSTRTWNLALRERRMAHETGLVELELASDEALLQDFPLIADTPDGAALAFQASVRAIVNNVILARIGATLEPGDADATFYVATAPYDRPQEALEWQPGVTAWDFIRPILEQVGLRLFCDGSRAWRLVTPDYVQPGRISVAEGFNLTRSTDTISRRGDAEWYDGVVIRYTWMDAANERQVRYDVASDGAVVKGLALEYDSAYPGPGAAAYILGRVRGRGRRLELEALSDYAAVPGMEIVATLPGTPVQTGYLSAVTWYFDRDEMQVNSRGLIDTPASAWLFLDIGQTWNDSPVGASWVSEVV